MSKATKTRKGNHATSFRVFHHPLILERVSGEPSITQSHHCNARYQYFLNRYTAREQAPSKYLSSAPSRSPHIRYPYSDLTSSPPHDPLPNPSQSSGSTLEISITLSIPPPSTKSQPHPCRPRAPAKNKYRQDDAETSAEG